LLRWSDLFTIWYSRKRKKGDSMSFWIFSRAEENKTWIRIEWLLMQLFSLAIQSCLGYFLYSSFMLICLFKTPLPWGYLISHRIGERVTSEG
jgi:hypothetical protein